MQQLQHQTPPPPPSTEQYSMECARIISKHMGELSRQFNVPATNLFYPQHQPELLHNPQFQQMCEQLRDQTMRDAFNQRPTTGEPPSYDSIGRIAAASNPRYAAQSPVGGNNNPRLNPPASLMSAPNGGNSNASSGSTPKSKPPAKKQSPANANNNNNNKPKNSSANANAGDAANNAGGNGAAAAGGSEPAGETVGGNKKAKRRPMSSHYTTKDWKADDAATAIAYERKQNDMQRMPMLMLRFPDPEVNKVLVKGYSKYIQNVHFQQPSAAR